ncbi:MAG: hypothetical protein Q8L02_08350, partial [Candidatus Nitrotoga sp.]|nr:hypothetical protein [Candidatus Nitrotoga sp.]
AKSRFWERCAGISLNERQIKLINRLLDGFEGKLTSSKWAAIAKCSPDSALRDINDLIERGVLKKAVAGGRSTSYELEVGGEVNLPLYFVSLDTFMTLSNKWRCCAVASTRTSNVGSRLRARMMGAILMASGCVPTTQITLWFIGIIQ